MGLLVGAHFFCRKGKGRAGSSRDPPPFPVQRPKGYFLRFQASIQRIYACLRQRLVEGRYAAGGSPAAASGIGCEPYSGRWRRIWERASGTECSRASPLCWSVAGCRSHRIWHVRRKAVALPKAVIDKPGGAVIKRSEHPTEGGSL
jgi:hypothetical protein